MRYIGIIILLVLCLTLLLLTGCVVNPVIPETAIGNLGNQENTEEPVIENTEEPVIENTEEPVIENTEEPVIENTEEPVIWSGLGAMLFSTSDNIRSLSSSFDNQVDTLIDNGFTQLRMEITYWADTGAVAISKSAITLAVSKGAEVIWGVGAAPATLTSTNWPTFRQGILDAAQWAQDNGVYEFQIGNEEELHNDDTTLTDAQLRTNLKAVATEVQAIFTNGNISYSCAQNSVNSWVDIGKGDIDILAANEYMGEYSFNNNGWKTDIANLLNAFGSDGTYLTEFSLSSVSLDTYSTDEAIQAAGVIEMIDYIKASGMTRAFFFCYYDDTRPFGPEGFGVLKNDGNYRLLWDQAILNSGSVKFATVPTKTTTISLPNTIALIPK